MARLTDRTSAARRRGRCILLAACASLSLSGCGSRPSFEFDALDYVPNDEKLAEFPLGEYRIPIPVIEHGGENPSKRINRFQLEFQLFALVSPREKSQVEAAWERHQGKVRDRVIRVCRGASLDDLQEPELATLKAHLIDALGPHLGENELRQLLITEVVSQEI